MKDTETRLTELETTVIELKNQEIKIAQLEAKISELTTFISDIQEQFILLPDVTRYGKLKQLLQQGDFRKADEETTRIMLEVSGEERDTLTPDDVSKYPCNSLQVIDEIWRKYSNQKFGFSIQLKTYYQGGGNLDTIRAQDITILRKFADEVGWLDENKVAKFEDYDNWDFTLSAPDGCFPAHWWKSPYGLKMVTFFFSRLISCNIA
ncbi:MAG: GUN4 domain-containing protein [Cyanobacteria bacterium]|nr:GUN4 domain-containing protein [Cyanobacteria bacterium CG_2015-16_32_12]NCO77193.1 GUN4 domain-containing protein [Cyanobacteria bacterium CG_2015-22_32_23]NCQ05628.1 GUN4 domain-containing protein [Cyanobacteria bacterium CG_2015-09_32_10]NCQ42138.1 GUN4 domain-containing protein [Cyanobacteria bacterium CG_2015-04_32_10]NCS84792.1 GUN4 domain-containing protein [Cyanobacteria bacterium CG_2015-02_32_10]